MQTKGAVAGGCLRGNGTFRIVRESNEDRRRAKGNLKVETESKRVWVTQEAN